MCFILGDLIRLGLPRLKGMLLMLMLIRDGFGWRTNLAPERQMLLLTWVGGIRLRGLLMLELCCFMLGSIGIPLLCSFSGLWLLSLG